jgi:hypothetical protein
VYGTFGTSDGPALATGGRFTVQALPSQLPLQHWDQAEHTSASSRHMPAVAVVHWPDLQRRPFAQSAVVRQTPPSAGFATQIPPRQP